MHGNGSGNLILVLFLGAQRIMYGGELSKPKTDGKSKILEK